MLINSIELNLCMSINSKYFSDNWRFHGLFQITNSMRNDLYHMLVKYIVQKARNSSHCLSRAIKFRRLYWSNTKILSPPVLFVSFSLWKLIFFFIARKQIMKIERNTWINQETNISKIFRLISAGAYGNGSSHKNFRHINEQQLYCCFSRSIALSVQTNKQ